MPLSSTDDLNQAAAHQLRRLDCIHAVPASPWLRCDMRRTGFVVPHTRTGPDLRCAVSHGRQPLPLLRSRVFRTLYTTDALRAAAFASSSIASCDTRDAYSFLSPIIFFRLLDPVWRYLPLCCLDVLMHSGNTMYYFWAYCKYKV